jgi:cell wall-associated NlpC family hydrolase
MTMWRAGHAVLRDADMQEMTIGAAVDADGALQRGDLVFWRGHVGIMTGPKTILHATEYTLRVVEEDFPAMRARLAGIGLDVTSVKRP